MSLTVEKPKISVIIPTYNHARYLPETIRSVTGQTYHDFEIIVVDDGSTDNTSRVVSTFGESVRYIRQENRGLAGARNTGIRAARGEFIGLLDADDLWTPEYLERMLPPFESSRKVGAVYCGWQYMDAAGNLLPRININVVPPEQTYEKMVYMDFLVPSGVMVRRECFDAVGYFDENLRFGNEDWDMWLRILTKYHMVGVSAALAKYRISNESMSAKWDLMEQSKRIVIAKHFGPEEDGGSNIHQIAYGGLYMSSALLYLQNGDVARGRSSLRRAFVTHPEIMNHLDTFYQVCLAHQPQGSRGVFEELDFEQIVQEFVHDMNAVWGTDPLPPELLSRQAEAYGNAYLALALIGYGCRRMRLARQFAFKAVLVQPTLLFRRQVFALLIKSSLGSRLVSYVRHWRARLSHSAAT